MWKKHAVAGIGILAALIVGIGAAGCMVAMGSDARAQSASPPSNAQPVMTEVLTLAADDEYVVINVEIARTPAEREVGLMNRNQLPDGRGMLFIWEQPTPVTMWMRNTPISLDMIFIRPDGLIHRIVSNTVPFSEDLIPSRGNVLAVLEVRGGFTRKIGLRPGHRVHHSAFETQN